MFLKYVIMIQKGTNFGNYQELSSHRLKNKIEKQLI